MFLTDVFSTKQHWIAYIRCTGTMLPCSKGNNLEVRSINYVLFFWKNSK